ncbi:hypothetical protein HOE22_00310 [Candidatus Woesearchaeota archaeon]|jgi:hypothetical protein|nr:hypothetical protein [Candidatus Neomarinimicrobiota bacterium]MBT4206770.1 hypothetical protein [Candidatus Woesearchaeota archaeon]
MILISHRGNLNGASAYENHPEYIQEALNQGFDVEIDVWWIDDTGFWLGHDKPQYLVDEYYLENPKFWCHAKNIEGLYKMLLNKNIHCFFHQEDDVTLTSKGYIWTYPNKQLTDKSIAVLPKENPIIEVAGICSDFFND